MCWNWCEQFCTSAATHTHTPRTQHSHTHTHFHNHHFTHNNDCFASQWKMFINSHSLPYHAAADIIRSINLLVIPIYSNISYFWLVTDWLLTSRFQTVRTANNEAILYCSSRRNLYKTTQNVHRISWKWKFNFDQIYGRFTHTIHP